MAKSIESGKFFDRVCIAQHDDCRVATICDPLILFFYPSLPRQALKRKQILSFERLGLSDDMLATLKKIGYEKPSPIQAGVIPLAMEEFDVIGGQRQWYRSLGDKGERVEKVNYRVGPPVEMGGELTDGRQFANFVEFRQMLLEDPNAVARALENGLAR